MLVLLLSDWLLNFVLWLLPIFFNIMYFDVLVLHGFTLWCTCKKVGNFVLLMSSSFCFGGGRGRGLSWPVLK